MAAAGIFDIGAIRSLAQNVREKRLAVHFAPVFGSVARAMRFDEDRSLNLFAFIALRGLISAGVRLGIVGPIEGQQIQVRLSAENAPITGDGGEPAQISPMIDLLQTTQDRLYSRLFQS
jgi:urease accessory protein